MQSFLLHLRTLKSESVSFLLHLVFVWNNSVINVSGLYVTRMWLDQMKDTHGAYGYISSSAKIYYVTYDLHE